MIRESEMNLNNMRRILRCYRRSSEKMREGTRAIPIRLSMKTLLCSKRLRL